MVDPVVRNEALQRHRRIALLSEVLRLKRKHKAYFDDPTAKYDTVTNAFANLESSIKTARGVRRSDLKSKRREIEKSEASRRIDGLMKTLTGRESAPNILFKMGGRVMANKGKSAINKSIFYSINVGWMWNYRVWNELYEGCATDYGHNLILRAEKVRVNHKWIELFEVLVYHVTSDTVRNGYVARTKTPKKNTVFHSNPSTAAQQAQKLMVKEMNLAGEDHGSED